VELSDDELECHEKMDVEFWIRNEESNTSDPFIFQRQDYEAAARGAADQLVEAGWGSFYADCDIEPEDADMDIWNAAVDAAIEDLIQCDGNPVIDSEVEAEDLVSQYTDNVAVEEFILNHNDFENRNQIDEDTWKRHVALIRLAYKTVARTVTRDEEEREVEERETSGPGR
jgi:hypothetical protein